MKNLRGKGVKWLSLVLLSVVALSIAGVVYSPVTLPSVYADPEETTANPGESFDINVNIEDVVDLYGWGIKISFNPSVLEVAYYMVGAAKVYNITEGPFLQAGSGPTSFVAKVFLTYINVGCTILGAYPGVSGSGILMTVTFVVKDSGKSDLDIYDSTLVDSTITPMDHTVSDGYFYTDGADLVGKSAWPEHHHFVVHKDEDFNMTGLEDANQTLFCKVKNLSPLDLNVRVDFDLVRVDDAFTTTVSTEVTVVPAGTTVVLTTNFTVTAADRGKYSASASAWYSWSGYYYTQGEKNKTFSFAVVP